MFKIFKKGEKQPKNLKEVLANLEGLEKKLKVISQELNDLKKNNKFHLQKIAIIRFNPFSEVGGDQSFSIALLDENNDGLVITSLYSREGNRVYGKPIRRGNSSYPLSAEEKKVIKKARGKHVKK